MKTFDDTNDGDYREDRTWFRHALGSAGFDDVERAATDCSGELLEFVDAAIALARSLNKRGLRAATDEDIERLTLTGRTWADYVDPQQSDASEARISLWECPRHGLVVLDVDGVWEVRNADNPNVDPLEDWAEEDDSSSAYEADVFQNAEQENTATPGHHSAPAVSSATLSAARMLGDELTIVSPTEQDLDGSVDDAALRNELAELASIVEARIASHRTSSDELNRAIESLAQARSTNTVLTREIAVLRDEVEGLTLRNESLNRSVANAARQLDDARREVLRLLELLRDGR